MPTYLAYSTATYQRDNQPKQQQHQRERERARESESESESERESGSERATSNSEQAQAVKGGGVGGSSTQHTLCPRPPVCAPPLSGAWAQTVTVTSNDTSVSVCGGGTGMSACAQTNNRDMGGRGYFRRDWMAYLFVTPRRAST